MGIMIFLNLIKEENYFKKADTEIIEYYLEFLIKGIEQTKTKH